MENSRRYVRHSGDTRYNCLHERQVLCFRGEAARRAAYPNQRINEKLAEAARLYREGRFAEWATLDREITGDIDRYADMKRAFGSPGKEAAV